MSDPLSQPKFTRTLLPGIVVAGFATSVSMWLVGFLTHLPGVDAAPIVVGVLLLVVQAAGAVCAGWAAPAGRGVLFGAGSGLVSALLNLLILGSVLTDPKDPDRFRANAIMLLGGYFAFSALLGGIGGLVGSVSRKSPTPVQNPGSWLGRFAVVAALSGVPVVLSGGLVTSAKAGLAVPDWPTSFSANMFLLPLSRMTGGIYYEHAHRLFGSLIGLSVMTLLVFTLLAERRVWAKLLVGGAFALVCTQGVLGGLRVAAATSTGTEALAPTTDNHLSLPLAMFHGIAGQLTVAVLALCAAVLSDRWRNQDAATLAPNPRLRNVTMLLVGSLLLQLALGAATRHFQSLHAAYTHMAFALLVSLFAALAAFLAIGGHREQPILNRLGNIIVGTLVLQLALGVATVVAVWPYKGVDRGTGILILATAHQAVGAALLVASCLLAAWTRRLLPV